MAVKLLGGTAKIQTPFISVQIGDYHFGVLSKDIASDKYVTAQKHLYPNFIQSLEIDKVNGAVNTYTLNMRYQIRSGDDPNFLERVFSIQAKTRKMIISYGDYSMPSFAYKEEACTITDVRSSIDFNSSSISYTITAISDALSLTVGTFNFPARKAKPSDVILDLLRRNVCGITEIFYGMRNIDTVQTQKKLVARDDKEIDIPAKAGVSILDYLNYLVLSMTPDSLIGQVSVANSKYTLVIHDDYRGELGGPYFTINKIESGISQNTTADVYEIDIGYPCIDPVLNFSIDNDQTYSILYNYAQEASYSDYIYRIDNNGDVIKLYSPTFSNNTDLYKTTEADKNWWSSVTNFPIKATLTIKGLLRAAILMSYVRINVYFYGQKHLSSGLYLITKQHDSISSNGYRTTLSLTRISGDTL